MRDRQRAAKAAVFAAGSTCNRGIDCVQIVMLLAWRVLLGVSATGVRVEGGNLSMRSMEVCAVHVLYPHSTAGRELVICPTYRTFSALNESRMLMLSGALCRELRPRATALADHSIVIAHSSRCTRSDTDCRLPITLHGLSIHYTAPCHRLGISIRAGARYGGHTNVWDLQRAIRTL